MFYEYFWFVLGIAALTGLAGTAWYLPRREQLTFSNQERTIAWLAGNPRLHVENHNTFTVDGIPDSHLWVSPSALCILWLRAPSSGPDTEPAGPLGQATAVKGWLTCWVDPKHWQAPLPGMLILRDALLKQGIWAETAQRYSLDLAQNPAGLPMLTGTLHTRNIRVEAADKGLWVHAEVDPTLRAVPGRGRSGNPVLDLCMDTHGIPETLATTLLGLLHEQDGTCQGGTLETSWRGDLESLFAELDRVLGYTLDQAR